MDILMGVDVVQSNEFLRWPKINFHFYFRSSLVQRTLPTMLSESFTCAVRFVQSQKISVVKYVDRA